MLTRRATLLLAGATLPTATLPGAALAAPAERLLVRGGRLLCGRLNLRCAVGRGGVRRDKREGDGGTPAGVYPLRQVLYRADRLPAPRTALPVQALRPADGWCDEPADPAYNRPVTLSYAASHEEMWRADRLYDLVAVIGYNDAPPVPGRGSAIFLHVAAPDWAATDGCVALDRPDLLAVLRRCGPATVIDIA